MAIIIDVRLNAERVQRTLDDAIKKQVPFALAQSINALAKEVAVMETANITQTFDNPMPFTRKSVGVERARKQLPIARVFIKDKTAAYLNPYEYGGMHKLNSRALLNPKDIKLNQYGQLARGTLARLKARPDIFIGKVKTKSGIVSGVWQRSTAEGKRLVGKGRRAVRGTQSTGQLKLLIRFGDALPVKKSLNFGSKAQALVNRRFNAVFGRELAKAIASAQ